MLFCTAFKDYLPRGYTNPSYYMTFTFRFGPYCCHLHIGSSFWFHILILFFSNLFAERSQVPVVPVTILHDGVVGDEVLHLEVARRVAVLVDPPGFIRSFPMGEAAFRSTSTPLPAREKPPDLRGQAAVVEVRIGAGGGAVVIWRGKRTKKNKIRFSPKQARARSKQKLFCLCPEKDGKIRESANPWPTREGEMQRTDHFGQLFANSYQIEEQKKRIRWWRKEVEIDFPLRYLGRKLGWRERVESASVWRVSVAPLFCHFFCASRKIWFSSSPLFEWDKSREQRLYYL